MADSVYNSPDSWLDLGVNGCVKDYIFGLFRARESATLYMLAK